MKKIVHESGEHDLEKGDSYTVRNGTVVVYLKSEQKRFTYPLSHVKYIEEDHRLAKAHFKAV